jgi:murein DD-endopeptidase MepM/ murein hydrolase activator NlpD
MVAGYCPRCASIVELHQGRPLVTANGAVELWHASCYEMRDVPFEVVTHVEATLIAPVMLPAPPRRSPVRGAIAGTVAGSALLAIVLAQHAFAGDSPASVDFTIANVERPAVHLALSTYEVTPQKSPGTVELEAAHPIVIDKKGVALDVRYPSLHGMLHPIVGTTELFPNNAQRHFGATRHGIEKPECGAGHCGVDLDGPRGRAIVAIADGVIVRAERRADGGDGISGRYVRIQHEDGALSSYFHMDDVAASLELGDKVKQGQQIGTLGSTAVDTPHLHFSIEIPTVANIRDISMVRYIDPAPFLLRATVVSSPDRRHAIKPAL